MKTRFGLVAVAGLMVLCLSTTADSQTRSKRTPAKKVVKKAPAKPNPYRGEVSLVGVRLMDDGITIINKYGSPDDIQAIGGGGGGSIGPAGGGPRAGGGGGLGGPGGGPTTQGGGGGGGSTSSALPFRGNDFDFGNEFLLQGPQKGPGGLQGGPPGGGGQGPGDRGPSMSGPDMGGGGGGMGGEKGARVLYTRWVYKRGPSRYGFVLNKFNKVVQIEAIGMNDGKVKTGRGVGFGANFATLQRKYGAPDGYEINGEQLVVRYLVKNKVAFRMSRLGENKPHVVTGVVVAGGKM